MSANNVTAFGGERQVFSTAHPIVSDLDQYTQDVVEVIEKHCGVTLEAMRGPGRNRRLALARSILWTCLRFAPLPYPPTIDEVAALTGHSRASVIHGWRSLAEKTEKPHRPGALLFAVVVASLRKKHPKADEIAERLRHFAQWGT